MIVPRLSRSVPRVFLHTLLAIGLATALAPPAALAESNFNQRLELDTGAYRQLVQNRQQASAALAPLRSILGGIQTDLQRLGTTKDQNTRMDLVESLHRQIDAGIEKAHAYQARSEAVRLQALNTLTRSGIKPDEAVPQEAVQAFQETARVFGDEAFADLPDTERATTEQIVALNRMIAGLEEKRRQAGLASPEGLTTAADLIALHHQAELNRMAGHGVERLMGTIRGLLKDIVVRESEEDLAGQARGFDTTLLRRVAEAAGRAIAGSGGPGGAGGGATRRNPFRP